MQNNHELSLLEKSIIIADANYKKTGKPIHFKELITLTIESLDIVDENNQFFVQLYTDIVKSSKFVYLGDGMWNLKEYESLKDWDKDGVDSIDKSLIDEEDEEEELVFEDEVEEDEEEELVFEDEVENIVEELEEEFVDEDDDDDIITPEDTIIDNKIVLNYDDVIDDDKFDEDSYEKLMDEYEEMYDE
ncbi:MAG: DNA-directed RNA polymerase subunit delta [Anaeroplasmataceae bacterium]